MIEETALVIEVKGDKALLQTERKNACQSCSVKSGCGTSTLSKVVGQRSSQFVVENTLNAKPGEKVVVAINEDALVQGSMLVYFLPLVIMLCAGLAAEYFFSSELMTILMVIIGLLLSMPTVRYMLSHSQLKNTIQPHLIRFVS